MNTDELMSASSVDEKIIINAPAEVALLIQIKELLQKIEQNTQK